MACCCSSPLVYLLPLVVMVLTSLKPLDEVTGGNMFALAAST